MLRFYSLLLILFSSFSALAQGLPGYVLTLAGDTLPGFIAEKKHQIIYLYPVGEGQRQTFRPSQIQGYGLLHQPAIRSRVVRLASGADSVCFVLPLQSGRANLYSLANETGLLLQPPAADTLHELTVNNWHLLFIQRLAGCPASFASAEELLKVRFTPDKVEQLVQRYNQGFAANEQPTTPVSNSPWRHGLGLRLGGQRLMLQSTVTERFLKMDDQVGGSGWGQFAGLEWTAVRANGLQMGLSGHFSRLTLTSHTYTEQSLMQSATERQNQSTAQLIGLALSVGKRLGHPGRPHFYMGGIMGSGYVLRINNTAMARPVGSSTPFQTTATYSNSGDSAPVASTAYISAEAGIVLPLRTLSELRLTAVYQKYVFNNIHTVGVQVNYWWYRK